MLDHPAEPMAFEVAASTRHSIAGLRALAEQFPRFFGRRYLVAPEAPLLHPHATSSGVGSLPLDQFLIAVGRQAEAAMTRNLRTDNPPRQRLTNVKGDTKKRRIRSVHPLS